MTPTLRILWLTIAVCVIPAIATRAQDAVLHIEKVPIFRGVAAGLLPFSDGTLAASFFVQDPNSGEGVPLIAQLDAQGNVLKRVIPSAATLAQYTPENGTGWPPYIAQARLPDGSFIVNMLTKQAGHQVVRLLPDGLPDPTGPISTRDSMVLPFADGKALIYDNPDWYPGQLGNPFDIYELRSDPNGSQFERLPLQFAAVDVGRKPRALAVAGSGHVWAFLVPAGGKIGTPGMLTRFLPDGRRDPGFNPPTPISDQAFRSWLGLTPEGGILVYVEGQPLRRFLANGQLDPGFVSEWQDNPVAPNMPLAVTPDGSFFAVRKGLNKFRPDGKIDPSFAMEALTEFGGFNWRFAVAAAAADGSLWLLHGGFRTGVTSGTHRIRRMLPDGRLDLAFSDHRLSDNAEVGIRVSAEIRTPNQSWHVEGTRAAAGDWGDFFGNLVESKLDLPPTAVPRRLIVYEAPATGWLAPESAFFRLVPAAP